MNMSSSFSSVDSQLIHPSLTLPPLFLDNNNNKHLSVRPQGPRGTSYPSPPMSKSPTPSSRSFDEYSQYHHIQDENSRHINDHKLSGPNGLHPSIRQPLLTVPSQHSQQYHQVPKTHNFPILGSSVPPSTTVKPARRTKAHVQSACYNCKKAHLSCDVARPCNRCVSSGKCDTCMDVPHKKRGRPRLIRDERGFRTQPPRAQQERPTPLSLTIPTQPIAAQGRTDLRVLKSQDEGRHVMPESYRGSFDPSAFTFQQPFQPRFTSAPMAFLDLEMNIIRTNQAINNTLGNGNDICGRNLDNFIAMNDKNNLRALKNKLKEEKEFREPSYLPPLGSSKDVPLVDNADIGRLTQGYQDRAEFLTFQFPNGQIMTLAVNVRLARTSCFFIILMLQEGVSTTPQTFAQPRSAQPIPQAYPYSAGLNVPGGWSAPQPASPYYTFGSGISPGATPFMTTSRNGSASYESYFNPSLTSHSYPVYAYPQPQMAQQPNMVYEPRQQVLTNGSELQLPPLALAGAPSGQQKMGADPSRWRVDSAVDMNIEYESDRMGKRQRMGVHDVLA